MIVNENLLRIWKAQGLTIEQMMERASSIGQELPKGYPILNELPSEIRNQRKPGSYKNYGNVVRSFRPTQEVDTILSNIKKGKVSPFVNRAILEFMKNKKQNGNK